MLTTTDFIIINAIIINLIAIINLIRMQSTIQYSQMTQILLQNELQTMRRQIIDFHNKINKCIDRNYHRLKQNPTQSKSQQKDPYADEWDQQQDSIALLTKHLNNVNHAVLQQQAQLKKMRDLQARMEANKNTVVDIQEVRKQISKMEGQLNMVRLKINKTEGYIEGVTKREEYQQQLRRALVREQNQIQEMEKQNQILGNQYVELKQKLIRQNQKLKQYENIAVEKSFAVSSNKKYVNLKRNVEEKEKYKGQVQKGIHLLKYQFAQMQQKLINQIKQINHENSQKHYEILVILQKIQSLNNQKQSIISKKSLQSLMKKSVSLNYVQNILKKRQIEQPQTILPPLKKIDKELLVKKYQLKSLLQLAKKSNNNSVRYGPKKLNKSLKHSVQKDSQITNNKIDISQMIKNKRIWKAPQISSLQQQILIDL